MFETLKEHHPDVLYQSSTSAHRWGAEEALEQLFPDTEGMVEELRQASSDHQACSIYVITREPHLPHIFLLQRTTAAQYYDIQPWVMEPTRTGVNTSGVGVGAVEEEEDGGGGEGAGAPKPHESQGGE